MSHDYKSDKDVVFALIRRYVSPNHENETINEIINSLGYDMGDYSFGKGDSIDLREKIKRSIIFLNAEFQNVFDENNNTKVSEGKNKNFV